jgi:hypothetical protein
MTAGIAAAAAAAAAEDNDEDEYSAANAAMVAGAYTRPLRTSSRAVFVTEAPLYWAPAPPVTGIWPLLNGQLTPL